MRPIEQQRRAQGSGEELASWFNLAGNRQKRVQAGIQLLFEATQDARHFAVDKWQYAPSIMEFLATGATGADLRWLITEGCVEHAIDRSDQDSVEREFVQPFAALSFSDRSCFVITEVGRKLASSIAAQVNIECPGVPNWDPQSRELRWSGLIVKRFRTPPGCQEIILAVFEEEHWPRRIDDPLKPVDGIDQRVRLHDTIKRLNRNQCEARIRFSRDGTGKGILWESVQSLIAPPAPPQRPLGKYAR